MERLQWDGDLGHLKDDIAAVLARARIGERLARHRGQPECVVEFAIDHQSGIEGDHGAAKLEHQATVEIEAKST